MYLFLSCSCILHLISQCSQIKLPNSVSALLLHCTTTRAHQLYMCESIAASYPLAALYYIPVHPLCIFSFRTQHYLVYKRFKYIVVFVPQLIRKSQLCFQFFFSHSIATTFNILYMHCGFVAIVLLSSEIPLYPLFVQLFLVHWNFK